MLEELFYRRKLNINKLVGYGFRPKKDDWIYDIAIMDNAVWRRKDNQKWYGAILTVSGSKLKLPTNEILEIIDLRLQRELMEKTVDRKYFFPGWHMNKNSWYTILLNNTVPTEEIYRRIDERYQLAKK